MIEVLVLSTLGFLVSGLVIAIAGAIHDCVIANEAVGPCDHPCGRISMVLGVIGCVVAVLVMVITVFWEVL